METRGLDDASCAVLAHRAPSTVYRWRTNGIDFIDWIGLVTLLALPPTWRPGDIVPSTPEGWSITNPLPGHAALRRPGRK